MPDDKKLIHFVWTGTQAQPATMTSAIKKFAELNPSCQVVVWTEGKLLASNPGTACQMPNVAARDIEKIAPAYGAASDVVRYKILHECGGVYLDLDTQAKAPIPDSVFSGTPLFGKALGQLSESAIACPAGSGVIKSLLDSLAAEEAAPKGPKIGGHRAVQALAGKVGTFPENCVSTPTTSTTTT
jgi:hypothetical protein